MMRVIIAAYLCGISLITMACPVLAAMPCTFSGEKVSRQYTRLIDTNQSQIVEPMSFLSLSSHLRYASVNFIVDAKTKEIEFSDIDAENCKRAEYTTLVSDCAKADKIPGLLCRWDEDYTQECCDKAYKYKDSECELPRTRSGDTCGGKYMCYCDRSRYPYGHDKTCGTPQVFDSDSDQCRDNGQIYYSGCKCPEAYAETCEEINQEGKGTSCTDGGKTLYIACQCKAGYNLTCSDFGPANATDYCSLNGVKYYKSCKDCNPPAGYTKEACKSGQFLEAETEVCGITYYSCHAPQIGDYLFSDRIIASTVIEGKKVIGIVFDPANNLAVGLKGTKVRYSDNCYNCTKNESYDCFITSNGSTNITNYKSLKTCEANCSQGKCWDHGTYSCTDQGTYNFSLLSKCSNTTATSCGTNGKLNTYQIMGEQDKGQQCQTDMPDSSLKVTFPVASYCYNYVPDGCTEAWCGKGQWFLGSAAQLVKLRDNYAKLKTSGAKVGWNIPAAETINGYYSSTYGCSYTSGASKGTGPCAVYSADIKGSGQYFNQNTTVPIINYADETDYDKLCQTSFKYPLKEKCGALQQELGRLNDKTGATCYACRDIVVGDILFSDKTISYQSEEGKTAIGIIVNVKKKLAIALDVFEDIWSEEQKDTSVDDCISGNFSSMNVDGTCNTGGLSSGKTYTRVLVNYAVSRGKAYPAAQLCYDYEPAVCKGTWCGQGQWFLPNTAELYFSTGKTNYRAVDAGYKLVTGKDRPSSEYWSSVEGKLYHAYWCTTSCGKFNNKSNKFNISPMIDYGNAVAVCQDESLTDLSLNDNGYRCETCKRDDGTSAFNCLCDEMGVAAALSKLGYAKGIPLDSCPEYGLCSPKMCDNKFYLQGCLRDDKNISTKYETGDRIYCDKTGTCNLIDYRPDSQVTVDRDITFDGDWGEDTVIGTGNKIILSCDKCALAGYYSEKPQGHSCQTEEIGGTTCYKHCCETGYTFDAFGAKGKGCYQCKDNGGNPLEYDFAGHRCACPDGYAFIEALQACGKCETGAVYDAFDNACHKCSSGTYDLKIHSCPATPITEKTCESGFTYDPETGKCYKCFYGEYDTATRRCPCKSGSHYDEEDKACYSCPSDYVYDESDKKCHKCKNGSYNIVTHGCNIVEEDKTCPSGYIHDPEKKACVTCQSYQIDWNGQFYGKDADNPQMYDLETHQCIMPILYADGSQGTSGNSSYKPIGIVVDNQRKLAIALDVKKMIWGEDGSVPETEISGWSPNETTSGKVFTSKIMAYASQHSQSMPAAEYCLNYKPSVTGLNSKFLQGKWFLGSLDEYLILFVRYETINRTLSKLGKPELSGHIWTANTVNATQTWRAAVTGGDDICYRNVYSNILPLVNY